MALEASQLVLTSLIAFSVAALIAEAFRQNARRLASQRSDDLPISRG